MNEKRKRHGLRLTLLGAAISLAGSLALTRWTCTPVDQTPPTIAAGTPALGDIVTGGNTGTNAFARTPRAASRRRLVSAPLSK